MALKPFEFVSDEVVLDPTGEGAKVLGDVALRNTLTEPVGVTFVGSETMISLDGTEIGGGALEVTHDEPVMVEAGGILNVRIGGGAGTDAADTRVVAVKTTIQLRWGNGVDDGQFITLRAVTSGENAVQNVSLTAGD